MKLIAKMLIIFFIMSFLLASFGQNENYEYSFFAAGHVYGNPNSPQLGLSPNFLAYLPQLNTDSNIELAFLTGDFVQRPTEKNYNAAQTDLNLFSMPYFIAAGNHD